MFGVQLLLSLSHLPLAEMSITMFDLIESLTRSDPLLMLFFFLGDKLLSPAPEASR